MNILILFVLLAVGFLLFLIIMNWRQTDNHRDSGGFYYYPPDDSIHQQHQTSISGQNESQSHSEGHWGGRDMSHDHHDFSSDSDSGGGGDWGGDAGGGDAGGGDGGGGGE